SFISAESAPEEVCGAARASRNCSAVRTALPARRAESWIFRSELTTTAPFPSRRASRRSSSSAVAGGREKTTRMCPAAVGPPPAQHRGDPGAWRAGGSREQRRDRPPSRLEALGLARLQLGVAPDDVVAVDEPPHERRSAPPSITEPRDFSKAKTREARDATG